MKLRNELSLTLPAIGENEAVARSILSAFVATVSPTVEELGDLRCAISEAVTNSVVHAYGPEGGPVYIRIRLFFDRTVSVRVADRGVGIADVQEARRPHVTTGPSDERAGMGFLVMESLTDRLTVRSTVGRGTVVTMWKKLAPCP